MLGKEGKEHHSLLFQRKIGTFRLVLCEFQSEKMQLADKKAVNFSYFIQILIFHRMVAKGLGILLRVLKKKGC